MMDRQATVERMKMKAEAVQTVVAEVTDGMEALRYVVGLTRDQGGSTIAAPDLSAEEQTELERLCREHGLSLVTDNLREHIGTIHTGFTRAGWGIAETGTLVIDSTREDTRIATMLCETHVALLSDSRIKADAMDLEEELTRLLQEAPRYLSFVSGASRTADIERVLTIGVHGPQELHILIMEESRS